jgi:hypothetical protein
VRDENVPQRRQRDVGQHKLTRDAIPAIDHIGAIVADDHLRRCGACLPRTRSAAGAEQDESRFRPRGSRLCRSRERRNDTHRSRQQRSSSNHSCAYCTHKVDGCAACVLKRVGSAASSCNTDMPFVSFGREKSSTHWSTGRPTRRSRAIARFHRRTHSGALRAFTASCGSSAWI